MTLYFCFLKVFPPIYLNLKSSFIASFTEGPAAPPVYDKNNGATRSPKEGRFLELRTRNLKSVLSQHFQKKLVVSYEHTSGKQHLKLAFHCPYLQNICSIFLLPNTICIS